MTIEASSGQGSGQLPGAVTVDDRVPAWLARLEGQHRRVVVTGIGLAALAGYLRSSRLVHGVIAGAIVAVAVAGLMRENQTRNIARLMEWDKRRSLRQQLADAQRGK